MTSNIKINFLFFSIFMVIVRHDVVRQERSAQLGAPLTPKFKKNQIKKNSEVKCRV